MTMLQTIVKRKS